MSEVSVEEIKRDINSFLHRIEEDPLVIVKEGKPLAEVRPLPSSSKGLRPYGLCAGEFIVPDDFDSPLPDNVVQLFEGR
jgi:antitoxin (DNA-binding transcriptional repressor) of toxin-antitoxin stability system